MKAWLFNVAYAALLLLWSPLLLWQQWSQKKKRGGWRERLLGPTLPTPPLLGAKDVARQAGSASGCESPPVLWLHAVSVGEINLLVTLVPALRVAFPGWKLAISSTTDSGLELARLRFPHDLVFRFPMDFSWAVDRVLRQLRPQALVLAELEIWPNTLLRLRQTRVPVLVINGRLSETSFRRYRWVNWLLRSLWRSLSLVAAQTDTYRQRFVQLGVDPSRCVATGSIKFDAAQFERQNSVTAGFRQWAGIRAADVVWLAGSTSAPEESLVLATYAALKPECPHLRLILVPRHRERFAEVAALCQASGHRFWQRSRLMAAAGDPAEPSPAEREARGAAGDGGAQAWEVLLVDTIGELAHWWGVADLGFVGGSMGSRGGQSMIEPAGFGVAMAFGPNTSNFRDVVSLLLENHAAVVVQDQAQLTEFVRRSYHDRDYRQQMGVNAQQISRQQQGATARTIQYLCPCLPAKTDGPVAVL